MDRFKYLSLGAVTVLVLVLVVGLAAVAGAVATAAIIDEVDDDRSVYNEGNEARMAVASAGAAVVEALTAAAARQPATAQASSGGSQAGIWVTGKGSIALEPDLAVLGLGVEARGETVSEALADASTAMDDILDALSRRDIRDRDVQTRRFNVRPEYEYQEIVQSGARREVRVLVGYVVSNTVTANIRDLDSVGVVIDDVATAGGDATRIDDIRFTVEDESAYADRLRSQASTTRWRRPATSRTWPASALGSRPLSAKGGGRPHQPGVQPVFRNGDGYGDGGRDLHQRRRAGASDERAGAVRDPVGFGSTPHPSASSGQEPRAPSSQPSPARGEGARARLPSICGPGDGFRPSPERRRGGHLTGRTDQGAIMEVRDFGSGSSRLWRHFSR